MQNETTNATSGEIHPCAGGQQGSDLCQHEAVGVAVRTKAPKDIPTEAVNVIAQYPELKKELFKQIKNNPAIGKFELETKAAELVSTKQIELRDNKRCIPKSQILARDADYLDAVGQVAPLIAASSREAKIELNADQLTIQFPFPPSSAHLLNALRDLKPKLKNAVDSVLATNGRLLISVSEMN